MAAAVDMIADSRTKKSSDHVEEFMENAIKNSGDSDNSFQGRLMAAGVPRKVVKSQCKDLLFAGVDPTALTLATTLQLLAKDQWR